MAAPLYRKLPGSRRGFLHGSSLWIAPDHLLFVKSLRFREEYKRFYLRDIQAIVVAGAARFHISTRAVFVAVLWLTAFMALRQRAAWVSPALWTAAVVLAASWLYVSYFRSCSCRIYTAVSGDDLPSVYRTWTARKFLAEVEPLILQVQGVLEGNWAEAVEDRTVGPAVAKPATPQEPTAGFEYRAPAPPSGRSHTLASDLFVACLFADALLNFLTLHSLTRTVQWIWYGLAFLEVGGAIVIFLQHRRGVLRTGMQKLAIATLIAMGAVFYIRQVMAGVSMGNQTAMPDPKVLAALPSYTVLREADAGVCLALGIAGLVMILRPDEDA